MNRIIKKFGIVALSLVTVISLSGVAQAASLTSAQIDAIVALLQSFGADSATISNVQSALTGGAVTPVSGTGVAVSCTFTRNLYPEMSGADVQCLQQYLNASGHQVAPSGVGSAGNETEYYGSLTTAAVKSWQDAQSLAYGNWGGYFGPASRVKYDALAVGGVVTDGVAAIVIVPAGTGLVVAKTSDTPVARTIGSGTAFNPALKVALTAGASNVSINSITLKKDGFITNTNLNGVDIIDSSGTRHGNVVTSIQADDTILMILTSDPIVVSAGKTEYITVRFNLLTGSYTGTVSFVLQSISSDASVVDASFPIAGAVMHIVDGGSSLASTTLDVRTSTGSSTLSVDAASLQEITKFRIQEVGSKEGAYLHSLTLYNYGNAGDDDYKDVTLEDQTGTVLATAQPSGQITVFNLSSPYFIDKGQTKDFAVKAKLIGGTTKTIQLVVYNNYDIDLRGSSTGISVIPGAGSADTSFPIGNGFNIQTIGSGSVTLTRASDSPSSAVTPGATAVTLAKFIAKPVGENYELRQVGFYIATSSSGIDLTGTVYVKVNGAIVYSVGASSVNNVTKTTVSLSSYPVLTAGVNNTIEISGDVNSSATTASTYKVTSFDLVQAKRLVTNDLVDPGTANTDGLTVAVKAAALVVTTLATPVANSVAVGINNYEFATIQLNAQSGGEDVKVSKIIVTDTLVAGAYTHVANLLMYKGTDTSHLPTSASTAANGATVTFNFTTPILVTQSTPVTLHLKADVTNSTSSHTYKVAATDGHITAIGAGTGNSLVHSTDITYAGSGQAQAIVTSGNLVLSLLSGAGASPSVTQVKQVGLADQIVFAFKMTSQYEEQKITTLKLTATTTAAGLATTTLSNIRLFEGSTEVMSASQFDTCDASKCEVTFTSSDNILGSPVPTTGVKMYVKADISAGGVALLGDAFKFQIASSTADVLVKGAVTGSTSGVVTGTPTAGGYTHIVPHVVTVSGVEPLTNETLGGGAGSRVAKFKVDNGSGNATIELASTTMTFAQGQIASTTVTFDMDASTDGGGTASVSGWTYAATSTTGTTGASSTIAFDISGVSQSQREIDAHRYLTIITVGVSADNDAYRFAVSELGNLTFQVYEGNLGYDNNQDGDMADWVYGLYIDGLPSLATVSMDTG